MSTIKTTTSSQIVSADTEADIKNHSGKEKRGIIKHKNEKIDSTRSHLNEVIEVYNKDELVENHYKERVAKSDRTNNSASRRYGTVANFVKSFEGKKMRNSDGVRSATASQLSYLGNKNILNPLIEEFKENGIPEDDIRNAYTAGYTDYVMKHNEEFPTLPIYRSDIHYDETTYHGHDAIVVLGHTKGGMASDSVNNALKEQYGYSKSNQAVMEAYREDNDGIIFDSITNEFVKLAEDNNMKLDFEMIRTGKGGQSHEMYQLNEEKVTIEKHFTELKKELDVEKEMSATRSKAQEKITDKNKKDKEDLKKEKDEISGMYADIDAYTEVKHNELREYDKTIKEQLEAEKEKVRAEKEKFRIEKEKSERLENILVGAFSVITSYSNTDYDHEVRDEVLENGFKNVDEKTIDKVIGGSIMDAVKNEQGKALDLEVDNTIHNDNIVQQQHVIEDEDDLEL